MKKCFTQSSQFNKRRNNDDKFSDIHQKLKQYENELNLDRLDSKNENLIKNSKSVPNSYDLYSKKLLSMFNKSEYSNKSLGDFNRILSNPYVSSNIKTKISDIYLKTVVDSKDSLSSKIKSDSINNNINLQKEIQHMNSKI
jgi:hypothetical protein